MRVFTWNLFVGPPCGSASLEKQLEYLAEQDADILCLQEVYAEGTLRRILEMFPTAFPRICSPSRVVEKLESRCIDAPLLVTSITLQPLEFRR